MIDKDFELTTLISTMGRPGKRLSFIIRMIAAVLRGRQGLRR